MSTSVIPAARLLPDPVSALTEVADAGLPVIFELPDGRRLTLSPNDDDDLTDRLIETNAEFRELLAESARSPRKPFVRTVDAE
jgi:hypothetical protein